MAEAACLSPKQYVATVAGRHGRFNVYETGDPRFYLFRLLLPGEAMVESEVAVPVRKRDLRPEVRRLLAALS